MNDQFLSNDTIFQDRDLRPAAVPTARLNSWKRLTEGDERADKFEALLRMMLVTSLLCAMFLCALRLRPAVDPADDFRLSVPTVSVPPAIEKAPAATVQAAIRAF